MGKWRPQNRHITVRVSIELTSTRGGGIITGGGKKAPADPEAEGDTDEELARRSSIALPPQLSCKQRLDFHFLAFAIFWFAAATCTEGENDNSASASQTRRCNPSHQPYFLIDNLDDKNIAKTTCKRDRLCA